MRRIGRMGGVVAGLMLAPLSAHELSLTLVDKDNQPLADAVVWVSPAAGKATAKPAVMDQLSKTFVPYILPVQTGTTVDFPNSDSINHHVYSFSPTKQFELKLFKGENNPHTVVFDKPGVVTLGCNLHDWMLAYVVVLDTPWFAQTNARGLAVLNVPDDLDAGATVQLWHPRIADVPGSLRYALPATSLNIRLQQPLKPDLRRQPRGYN